MTRTVDYLRRNALAALALVCSLLSLAGASYAALSLPAGSVGSRQLQNGAVTAKKIQNRSITPIKFDPSTIGGSVRHWAHVSQDGQIHRGQRGRSCGGWRPHLSRELGGSVFVAVRPACHSRWERGQLADR